MIYSCIKLLCYEMCYLTRFLSLSLHGCKDALFTWNEEENEKVEEKKYEIKRVKSFSPFEWKFNRCCSHEYMFVTGNESKKKKNLTLSGK